MFLIDSVDFDQLNVIWIDIIYKESPDLTPVKFYTRLSSSVLTKRVI